MINHIKNLQPTTAMSMPEVRKFRINDECKNAHTKASIEEFIKKSLEAFRIANPDNSRYENIFFIFDECKILEEFRILDIYEKVCRDLDYEEFCECLIGKNQKFNISFSFRKTRFEKHARFDHLVCKSLDFYNTSFKKGALLRWLKADEVIYRPWELGADVTFGNAEYADIKNQKLTVNDIGEIKYFKFRHNFEGNGWTYFIGVKFTDIADFSNTVLNKVHFSNMDMSYIYFSNAIIQDTRFLNCDFPKKRDIWGMSFANNAISPQIQSFFMFLIVSIIFLVTIYGLHSNGKYNASFNNSYVFVIFSIVSIFFLNFIFMFTSRLLNPFARHIGTADEDFVWQEKDPDKLSKNIAALREVYRQLRANLEKNNDFQKAGEFYFSQRHIELAQAEFKDSTKSLLQQALMGALHWINGFGERWLRALVWFFLTILIFAYIFKPNIDFVATKDTPKFLLDNTEYIDKAYSYPKSLQDSLKQEEIKFLSLPNEINIKTRGGATKYTPKLNEDNNSWIQSSSLAYSLSHLVAPFTSDEKKWFAIASEKGYIAGFLETILLWLFAFSFAVAIKNRIKR